MEKYAEARSRARAKYDAANTVRYSLKLNRKTDAEIIDRLEAEKESSGSVQGYIKGLIRDDIAPRNAPRKS